MFSMTQWHWVALAWLQLIVFYIGYLLYLNWRYRRVRERLEEDH